MFEFRWLVSEKTTTKPPVLQYRTHEMRKNTIADSVYYGTDWSEWKNVPVVVAQGEGK